MWFLNNPNEKYLKSLNLGDKNSAKDYIKSKPFCKGKDCPIILVGAPGYDVFKFKPIKTGKVKLNFNYKQPFMMDEKPEESKTLIVNIHE